MSRRESPKDQSNIEFIRFQKLHHKQHHYPNQRHNTGTPNKEIGFNSRSTEASRAVAEQVVSTRNSEQEKLKAKMNAYIKLGEGNPRKEIHRLLCESGYRTDLGGNSDFLEKLYSNLTEAILAWQGYVENVSQEAGRVLVINLLRDNVIEAKRYGFNIDNYMCFAGLLLDRFGIDNCNAEIVKQSTGVSVYKDVYENGQMVRQMVVQSQFLNDLFNKSADHEQHVREVKQELKMQESTQAESVRVTKGAAPHDRREELHDLLDSLFLDTGFFVDRDTKQPINTGNRERMHQMLDNVLKHSLRCSKASSASEVDELIVKEMLHPSWMVAEGELAFTPEQISKIVYSLASALSVMDVLSNHSEVLSGIIKGHNESLPESNDNSKEFHQQIISSKQGLQDYQSMSIQPIVRKAIAEYINSNILHNDVGGVQNPHNNTVDNRSVSEAVNIAVIVLIYGISRINTHDLTSVGRDGKVSLYQKDRRHAPVLNPGARTVVDNNSGTSVPSASLPHSLENNHEVGQSMRSVEPAKKGSHNANQPKSGLLQTSINSESMSVIRQPDPRAVHSQHLGNDRNANTERQEVEQQAVLPSPVHNQAQQSNQSLVHKHVNHRRGNMNMDHHGNSHNSHRVTDGNTDVNHEVQLAYNKNLEPSKAMRESSLPAGNQMHNNMRNGSDEPELFA